MIGLYDAEWKEALEKNGHVPKLDKDGSLFCGFYFDSDGTEHNGPECTRCSLIWCAWCVEPSVVEECENPITSTQLSSM